MNVIDSTSEKIHFLFRKLKEKNKLSFKFLNNVIFQRWAIAMFLSVGLTLILAPNIYYSKPEYKHGMIARDNIKADRDFLVEDANSTRQKRNEASEYSRQVFDYDAEMAITLKNRLKKSLGTAASLSDPGLQKITLENTLGITVSANELAFIKANLSSEEFLAKLFKIISSFYENRLITSDTFQKAEREKGIIMIDVITRKEENLKEVSSVLHMKDIDPLLRKIGRASCRVRV